jgi:sulfite exporter TauE/SafE
MGALAAAALVAGFLGGVHCIGMCGGLAGALSAAARGPALRRQAAFNFGRIASYTAGGALAGGLGSLVQTLGPVNAAQTALFIVANIFMVLLGLYVAGWGRSLLRLESAGGAVWRRIEPLRRHFLPIDSDARALGAGAVWGWIPCGLVYSMLALALASGSALAGAGVLAAFGIGTLPAMLGVGVAAQRLFEVRRNPWVRRGAGMAIIALAVVGFLRVPMLQELAQAGWVCLQPT